MYKILGIYIKIFKTIIAFKKMFCTDFFSKIWTLQVYISNNIELQFT